MLRARRKVTLLACALLALPGLAGAQPAPAQVADSASLYRARNFYFVFKLATTLPLTVQDTPECAADQRAVSSGLTSTSQNLMTYGFVSSLDRAALAGVLDTFLRDHTFRPADLPPEEGDRPASDLKAARTLTDPGAPGFSYTVRLHDRSGGASVLCVNLRMPPAPPLDPASPSSQETS